MAFTDAYATPQDYRSAVKHSDTADEEDIKRDLMAVSRYLDRELHQFFNFTSDAEGNPAVQDRYYMPVHRANPRAPYLIYGYGYAESENPWVYLRADPN